MKNNRGITLIALTITIIVIIIIASVVTYSGASALRDAKEDAQLSEVEMLQQVVLENYTKYKTVGNDMYLRGTAVSYEDVSAIANEMGVTLKVLSYTDTIEKSTEYYYRLSADDLNEMGVAQVVDSYIVNYKTGEVINETLKVTRSGKPLYVYGIDSTNL